MIYYKYLQIDDVIKEGDEWLSSTTGVYQKYTSLVGRTITAARMMASPRRPMKIPVLTEESANDAIRMILVLKSPEFSSEDKAFAVESINALLLS